MAYFQVDLIALSCCLWCWQYVPRRPVGFEEYTAWQIYGCH